MCSGSMGDQCAIGWSAFLFCSLMQCDVCLCVIDPDQGGRCGGGDTRRHRVHQDVDELLAATPHVDSQAACALYGGLYTAAVHTCVIVFSIECLCGRVIMVYALQPTGLWSPLLTHIECGIHGLWGVMRPGAVVADTPDALASAMQHAIDVVGGETESTRLLKSHEYAWSRMWPVRMRMMPATSSIPSRLGHAGGVLKPTARSGELG